MERQKRLSVSSKKFTPGLACLYKLYGHELCNLTRKLTELLINYTHIYKPNDLVKRRAMNCI